MSENRTMSPEEQNRSSLKTTPHSKYKMGEWEDMEEDFLLEALEQLKQERQDRQGE